MRQFKLNVLAGVALIALATPADALQQPTPGKADSRIRYVTYDPANVVEIWSAPGAVITIEFAEGETVVNVAASDSHTLNSAPRDNFLFFKPKGCMVPEPVTVLTRNAAGKMRRYNLQVETKPHICPNPTSPIVAASTGGDTPTPTGANLKYISSENALAQGADVSYAVVYKYPGDERAAREKAEAQQAAREEKERAATLLTQQPLSRTGFNGTARNYRYMARGNGGLIPSSTHDDGMTTVMVFPAMQRVPAVLRINPDGKEATVNFSVHDSNTLIVDGTAQLWRLRDGGTVMEIYNFGYNAYGQTPDTGTTSPDVRRILKANTNDR